MTNNMTENKNTDNNTYMIPTRGDIFFADLSDFFGSEQGGVRPVVVVQNDVGNKYSPTVIVATLTSNTHKKPMPTHVSITPEQTGIPKQSIILFEQIKTIDKKRLGKKIGYVEDQDEMNKALMVSFGLVH